MVPRLASIKGNNAKDTGGLATASIAPPRIAAARIDATLLSKMSAPLPATSPTLSPTSSAIAAGFLGSSSGI